MYIYKIKNLINNKAYIGQTIKTPEMRWNAHKSNVLRGAFSPLYNSIRKYGVNSFEMSTLQKCTSERELDEAERFWIKALKTQNRAFGYNIAEGGNDGRLPSELYKIIGAKAAITRMQRGVKCPEYIKKRYSEERKGIMLSEEHKSKISNALDRGYRSGEIRTCKEFLQKKRTSEIDVMTHLMLIGLDSKQIEDTMLLKGGRVRTLLREGFNLMPSQWDIQLV